MTTTNSPATLSDSLLRIIRDRADWLRDSMVRDLASIALRATGASQQEVASARAHLLDGWRNRSLPDMLVPAGLSESEYGEIALAFLDHAGMSITAQRALRASLGLPL